MDMVLKYKDASIRTDEKDGQLYFVATDVAHILGYRDAENATRYLDDDEKGTLVQCTPGGQQAMLCVTESGLYTLILKSDKPEAKEFKRWVTHDVLPSIRQHGFYIDPTFEMHTQDIADLLLMPHVAVIKQVGNVLPQYWYHCNSVGRNKGLKLNALESFLVIARSCRENLRFIAADLPIPVRKIAAGMGVRFDVTFSEYKKMIL